ncbi:hypothetical protein B0T10DRAFT_492436 [Thelonectria olida]|uniref:Uncharacterized protein n=1 Tax=Thelonectria olida TaxID=1576542 RepID=A0A9P8W027_9HYPO|nr:hypothetical protein B0T10DRAFT_492436 [Thelonectria olida]
MVSLSKVRESNLQAPSALPAGLVAVFAGGTAGIGEMAMKAFTKHTLKPTVYFIGRSQEAADRLLRELKTLNPEGVYHFIKTDLSLLKNVDEVCRDIRNKEKTINVLFMTQGTLNTSTTTEEGLRTIIALTLYSRTRMTVNLLPAIQQAPSVRRVITVLAGTKEGALSVDDIPGNNVGITKTRGHGCSVLTLSLEEMSRQYPEVSFIHNFPGSVDTGIIRPGDGIMLRSIGVGFRVVMNALNKFLPEEEVGERHAFFCLSGRYPPKHLGEGMQGVPSDAIAAGADGKSGSGFYSLDWDGESASDEVVEMLDKYRAEGMVGKVWEHLEGEFKRITGTTSI